MIIFTLLVTGVKSYRIYITFEDQKKAYNASQGKWALINRLIEVEYDERDKSGEVNKVLGMV